MPIDVGQRQEERDPAQPTYVFRGHTAHIHSVQILQRNTCLLTGDADGWVVYWKLETKRPLAVWKAHDAAILGTAEWGPDKIITHGRDNALRIWQLDTKPASYSTVLPADGANVHRPKPWLLHSLPVNTLNFCAFTMCYQISHPFSSAPSPSLTKSIYIAVPGRDDKKAEIYQFPEEKLICVVPKIETSETGMVMALKLVHHRLSNNILVIAGYESGFTAVHLVPRHATDALAPTLDLAQIVYLSQPHTQPILSVDALSDGSSYFTSSADAVIAAHRVPELPLLTTSDNDLARISATDDVHLKIGDESEHAASSGEAVSVDDVELEIPAATRSPQSSADTQSTRASPPAPLSFPKTRVPTKAPPSPTPTQPSNLSALLAKAPPQINPASAPEIPKVVTAQPPYKLNNTKHAGQQSLRVRSDDRLIVTGGWDSRVRIYSTKSLKEVAVLKWHKEGVYAAAFGEVIDEDHLKERGAESNERTQDTIAGKERGLQRLQRQREEVIRWKHWVAAGAKDGRVSLWEVF